MNTREVIFFASQGREHDICEYPRSDQLLAPSSSCSATSSAVEHKSTVSEMISTEIIQKEKTPLRQRRAAGTLRPTNLSISVTSRRDQVRKPVPSSPLRQMAIDHDEDQATEVEPTDAVLPSVAPVEEHQQPKKDTVSSYGDRLDDRTDELLTRSLTITKTQPMPIHKTDSLATMFSSGACLSRTENKGVVSSSISTSRTMGSLDAYASSLRRDLMIGKSTNKIRSFKTSLIPLESIKPISNTATDLKRKSSMKTSIASKSSCGMSQFYLCSGQGVAAAADDEPPPTPRLISGSGRHPGEVISLFSLARLCHVTTTNVLSSVFSVLP